MVKNTLFPIDCLQCGVEGKYWCEQCRTSLEFKHQQACPVCWQASLIGKICPNCQAVSYLNGITAFFDYDEKDYLAKLIKQFKYNHVSEIATIFEQLLDTWLSRRAGQSFVDFFSTFCLIPVPLHIRRLRQRGFNQAEVLAKIIERRLEHILSFKVGFDAKNLVRSKNTIPQVGLSGVDRRKNLSDAFIWSVGATLPKQVLLVDDVFTTGATMQECAKVLKQNGAQTVWGLVLARG